MSRPARDWRMNSHECYNAYKEKYPQSEIQYSVFKVLVKRYNESIIEYCLDTGRMAVLPNRFGQLFVNKKKQVRFYTNKEGRKFCILGVDWKLSKELGKKIYLQNFHTEGYRFKFVWRYSTKIYLKGMWTLKITRNASRTLAKNLKENPQKYLSIYQEWQTAPLI